MKKIEVGMKFDFNELGTIKIVKINGNNLTILHDGIVSHVSIKYLEYQLASGYCELV